MAANGGSREPGAENVKLRAHCPVVTVKVPRHCIPEQPSGESAEWVKRYPRFESLSFARR